MTKEELEKEAEKYVIKKHHIDKTKLPIDFSLRCEFSDDFTDFQKGAEFGYNKAFVEADKNLKAIVTDFNKANEWHRADIPTSQINKVVLGYIKDYNSKMFCLVKWNGEWWYDARTYNERVKLIAWKEIVLPKEITE